MRYVTKSLTPGDNNLALLIAAHRSTTALAVLSILSRSVTQQGRDGAWCGGMNLIDNIIYVSHHLAPGVHGKGLNPWGLHRAER